jgi:GxxExxY protein
MVEEHKAQTLSYLAVSGLRLGLLINFGERSLNWYRLIL